MKKILKILPVLMLICLLAFTVQASDTSEKAAITLKVKNTTNGVYLSWNGNKKTTYSVYRKNEKGKYVKIASPTGKKYTDKEVTSGKKYSYYVRKTKKIQSAKVSVTYIAAPKIRKASTTDKGLFLRWKAVEGAEKYVIYRRTEKGKFKRLTSTSLLSYTDSTAEKNVKYYYALKAYKDDAYSVQGKEYSAVRLVSPDVTSIEKKYNGLSVSWKKVKAADKYIVYRRQSEKEDWKEIARISSGTLTYKDTAVKTGKSYSYCVNVLIGTKESSFSGKYMSCTYIGAPKEFNLEQKNKKVTLTWKKVSSATGYQLYRKVGDGKWKKHKVLGADEIKFSEKLTSVKDKVSYKIRTITQKGKSAFTKSTSIRYVDPKKPMVALTYDDGPHPTHTHTILDVLEKYDARATFFVVGSRIEPYSDCLERQNKLGCEIGNHSYSHISLSSNPDKTVKEQISKTDKLIKKYSGQICALARAPGGSVGKALKLIDKPFIQWSVDTRDWESRSSKKIVSHIKKTVRDGSIVLMHDLYGSTAKATEEIVPWLIKKGYQLVTVSELMEAKGIKLKEGKIYYNGYS